jgi:hypothetical protein
LPLDEVPERQQRLEQPGLISGSVKPLRYDERPAAALMSMP